MYRFLPYLHCREVGQTNFIGKHAPPLSKHFSHTQCLNNVTPLQILHTAQNMLVKLISKAGKAVGIVWCSKELCMKIESTSELVILNPFPCQWITIRCLLKPWKPTSTSHLAHLPALFHLCLVCHIFHTRNILLCELTEPHTHSWT